jgi:glycosyltransferase involved in cell wall biosynthesis
MPKICIIIPCYNEENRLDINIYLEFIKKYTFIVLLFVNDGSSDNTTNILLKIVDNQNIFLLNLSKNQGKAEAVRRAALFTLNKIKSEWLAYWDADLATPLDEILHMYKCVSNNSNLDLVFASRIKRVGSNIERSALRHIIGRVLSSFVSIILKMPIYDSQCGAKLFRTSLVELIFKEEFLSKWLFDIELIARFRNHYGLQKTLNSLLEYPVLTWKEIPGSKIKFSYFFRIPIDLYKIHEKYN